MESGEYRIGLIDERQRRKVAIHPSITAAHGLFRDGQRLSAEAYDKASTSASHLMNRWYLIVEWRLEA